MHYIITYHFVGCCLCRLFYNINIVVTIAIANYNLKSCLYPLKQKRFTLLYLPTKLLVTQGITLNFLSWSWPPTLWPIMSSYLPKLL